MTIEKIRTQIVSGIWQGIAQSGVDLASIGQGEQDKLVKAITERMMVTLNSILDEAVTADELEPEENQTAQKNQEKDLPGEEYDEKILWQGRPFLALAESYVVTNERIKIIHGLLSRRVENYELVRMQDIDFKQNVGERMMGIGDIFIQGHDASDPKITLRDIRDPEGVYELLRRAWMESRKRHGLQFREYM